MWIKVILSVGILSVAFLMLRTGASDRNAAIRRLGMAAFSVLAIILVIYPSLTTQMANLVGVKRGADLVFYMLVLAFLGSLLTAAQRNVRTERKLTRIARQLALQNVDYPQTKQEEPAQPQVLVEPVEAGAKAVPMRQVDEALARLHGAIAASKANMD